MKSHLLPCYFNINPKQLQHAQRKAKYMKLFFFSVAQCLFFKRLDNWHLAINCCFSISKHLLTYCRIEQNQSTTENSLSCIKCYWNPRTCFVVQYHRVRPFMVNQLQLHRVVVFREYNQGFLVWKTPPAICFQHKAKVQSFTIFKISFPLDPVWILMHLTKIMH